ncbi:MAG: autotransporter strand-loop-strand O-heptosyltransferase [Lentisphaeria bacterium]|nr:autotransporter strand-loop-strand O-heptosyltransferase [Lentisphaeria bacterium]
MAGDNMSVVVKNSPDFSLSVSVGDGCNLSVSGQPELPAVAVANNQQAGVAENRSSSPRLVGRITSDIGPDPGTSQTKIKFDDMLSQEAVEGIRFDFAFGYRISIPAAATPRTYLIKIFDQNSGLMLWQAEMKSGQTAIGQKKFLIRYRLEIHRDGQMIFAHDFDLKGRKVYAVIPDGGLGDNLAWLPIVEEFRKTTGANVTCVIGEWIIKLCGDLYPALTFIPVDEHPLLHQAYACYFCGIFDAEHLDWRPIEHQKLGMQGSVESILGLPIGVAHKCRLHTGCPRPFPEPYVCISSMGTNPCKCWNYDGGWNQVIRFLKACGYRVLDIDRDSELFFAGKRYAIPTEAEDFTGRYPIQERIDLLEHADFFIGLPSGLSWLAWELDKPVVIIAGFTLEGSEFPTPYRVTNFLACHGCWNDSRCFFDQKVPVWCPRHVGTPREIECTRAVTTKMVIDTIMKIPEFRRQTENMILKQAQEVANGQA